MVCIATLNFIPYSPCLGDFRNGIGSPVCATVSICKRRCWTWMPHGIDVNVGEDGLSTLLGVVANTYDRLDAHNLNNGLQDVDHRLSKPVQWLILEDQQVSHFVQSRLG